LFWKRLLYVDIKRYIYIYIYIYWLEFVKIILEGLRTLTGRRSPEVKPETRGQLLTLPEMYGVMHDSR